VTLYITGADAKLRRLFLAHGLGRPVALYLPDVETALARVRA
jgi:hypothetical protein